MGCGAKIVLRILASFFVIHMSTAAVKGKFRNPKKNPLHFSFFPPLYIYRFRVLVQWVFFIPVLLWDGIFFNSTFERVSASLFQSGKKKNRQSCSLLLSLSAPNGRAAEPSCHIFANFFWRTSNRVFSTVLTREMIKLKSHAF